MEWFILPHSTNNNGYERSRLISIFVNAGFVRRDEGSGL